MPAPSAPVDMTQHDVDQVSASELLVTMVEAKHMLETDIADLNKVKNTCMCNIVIMSVIIHSRK